MFALVDIKGKQYKLEEGRYLDVDLLDQQPEAELVLDNVLMVVDGSNTLVGAPYVDGAKATVQVVDHRRDAKVIVYKMRCKKGYRLKNGHRQDYTRIQVNLLEFPGKTASKKAAVASSDETAAAPKAKKAAKKVEEVTSDAE